MASLVLTGALELQKNVQSLMSDGTKGKKIFRKGLRAGAKVIAQRVKTTFPVKTGRAAKSTKVKAMKRKRDRIGVRVALFAASEKGYPYPMGLERGTKNQPKGGRIRKERNEKAYNSLAWHVKPQHNVEKAFDESADAAQTTMNQTFVDEMEKEANIR